MPGTTISPTGLRSPISLVISHLPSPALWSFGEAWISGESHNRIRKKLK